MGRPITFDPQEKLNQAMMLFWRQGFEATSVQQLVETLGINRFSLYHCYGDKSALFRLALDHYRQTVIRRLVAPLLSEQAALAQIIEYLDNLQSSLTGRGGRLGCMVQNAGIERGQTDPQTQATVDRWYEELEALLCSALQRTREARRLQTSIDPHEAAAYLVTVLQGIIAERRSGSQPSRLECAMRFLVKEVRGWEIENQV